MTNENETLELHKQQAEEALKERNNKKCSECKQEPEKYCSTCGQEINNTSGFVFGFVFGLITIVMLSALVIFFIIDKVN